MCNPVALFAMTAFTAVAQVAQSSAQASAVKAQAANQAAVGEWNAKQQDAAATDALQRGSNSAANIRENARRANSTARAVMSSNGIIADEGSGGFIQDNNAQVGAFDALTQMNNAEREAYGFTSNAQNLRLNGQLATSQAAYEASAIRRNGLLNAAGTLVTGGGKFYDSIYNPSTGSADWSRATKYQKGLWG